MAGGRTLTVSLVANTKSFGRGMADAVRNAEGFKGKMAAVGSSLSGVAGPALAAAGAAAGAFAIKLGVDAVQGAMAEQKELANLQSALDNVGQGFRMPEVDAFISRLQMAYGESDSNLRPAFQQLVTATGDVAKSMDLMNLAMDVSAGTGKDLSSVTAALAKASNGSFTAIGKLTNGAISPAILATGDLAQVTGALSQKFGGAAAAAAGTFAGKVARVQQAVNELSDSFGTGFLSAFDDSADGVNTLQDALINMQPELESMGKSLGEISSSLMNLAPLLSTVANYYSFMVGWQSKALEGIIGLLSHIPGLSGALGDNTEQTANSTEAYKVHHAQLVLSTKAALLLRDGIMETGSAAATAADEGGPFMTWVNDIAGDMTDAGQAANDLTDALGGINDVLAERSARQDFKNSLKEFIANPSAETRDAVVAAMTDAAGAIKDPGEQATFTSKQIDAIKDAARRAGIPIPAELKNSMNDAETAADNAAAAAQRVADNVRGIPTTWHVDVQVNGTYYGTPPPGGWPTATGGYRFARGGPVFGGGTHNSDSIAAMLSRGEYVLNAHTVKRVGIGRLDQLNNGGPANSGNGAITVNVTSAPGERAEETVPRALRRMAFLAGING